MTYGRSYRKVLDALAIPFASWPTLAADRAAWRDAINGGLLNGGRPRRSKTRDETDRLIAVSLANAGASTRDLRASVATSIARAAPRRAPLPPPAPTARSARRRTRGGLFAPLGGWQPPAAANLAIAQQ